MSRNHPMEGAGPGTAMECRCLRCNLIVLTSTERSDCVKAILIHLEADHGGGPNVILQGQDFTLGPAVYRCDLCLVAAEPPWWTYITPSTPEYRVEDEAWLVCDACQVLVQDRDTIGLILRCVRVQRQTFVCLPPAQLKERMRMQITRFLSHIKGQPVRGMT